MSRIITRGRCDDNLYEPCYIPSQFQVVHKKWLVGKPVLYCTAVERGWGLDDALAILECIRQSHNKAPSLEGSVLQVHQGRELHTT